MTKQKVKSTTRLKRAIPDKALLDLQSAADKARASFENQTAIELYTQGIERLEAATVSSSPGLRVAASPSLRVLFDLLAGRAECYERTGDLSAQAVDLEEMARLAQELDDAARQIDVLILRSPVVNRQGNYAEGARVAQAAVELARQVGDRKREADSLSALGETYRLMSNFARAQACAEKALRIHRKLGDRSGMGSDLRVLGGVAMVTGKSVQAQEYLEEALALHRALGDRMGEAMALNAQGIGAGDEAQRRTFYEQALGLLQLLGHRERQARIYNNLGLVYWSLGLYGKACDYAEHAVQIGRDMQAWGYLEIFLESLARPYLDLGEYDRAEQILQEGRSLAQDAGDRRLESGYTFGLGRLALARGQRSEAREQFQAACDISGELDSPAEQATGLAWLGAANLALGDWEAANRCTSQAVELLEAVGDTGTGFPPQEVWWWRYQVLKKKDAKTPGLLGRARRKGDTGKVPASRTPKAGPGARPRGPASLDAWACLDHAHRLMLAGIATLSDEGLRRNYLNKVTINREIMLEWMEQAAGRGIAPTPPPPARAGNLQEQLRRVMEIGVRMNEQRDPEALLNFIMDEAVELNGAERSLLVLLDANGQPDFRIARGIGSEEMEQVKGEVLALLDRVAQSRQGVLTGDAEAGAGEHTGMRPASPVHRVPASILAVPLISGGKLTGLLYADNRVIFGEFDRTDLDLLSVFANQAATALENARLYHGLEQRVAERTAQLQTSNAALEQRKAELEIINSVQKALAAQLDIQAIYDLVGDKIQEIFDAQEVDINTYDRATNLLQPRYVVEKGLRFSVEPRSLFGFRKHVVETRQPLVVNQDAVQAAIRFDNPVVVGEMPRSMVFVPMIVGDQVTGIISLQNIDREDAFSESDVRLLQTLASSMSVALENARLFDETKRLFEAEQQRAAELAIINSVQQGLASKLEFQGIIDLVGDKLREVFGTQDIGIRLYDPKTNLVHYPYEIDHGQRLTVESREPGGISRIVLESRETVVINHDMERRLVELGSPSTELLPGTEMSKSMAVVPIVVGSQPTGIIVLDNYEKENAFTEADVRLLQTLASSMSVALENARLFDETKRLFEAEQQRAAELAVISSVQQGLASKLDMQGIYDLVGDKIRDLFDAQVVMIGTYDQATQLQHYRYAVEKDKRGPLPPQPLSDFAQHLIRTRQLVLINDDAEQRGAALGMRTVPGTEEARSVLFVPLVVGSEVKGSISLQNVDRENAFSESDVRLLTTLASSMSVALENARLFEETNRLLAETRQRAAELEIINTVGQALAAQLDMQGIYDLVGDKIQEIFDAQAVMIASYDREANLVHCHYLIEKGERFYPTPWLFTRVTERLIRTRQVLLLNNAEQLAESGSMDISGTEPTKSALFVPLIAGNEVRGAISLQNVDRENAFTESDVRLLTTLASSMGVALQNARLFDELQARNRQITEALEQQTATSDILRVIAGSPTNVQPVLDAVAQNAARLCEAEDALIFRVDGKNLRMVASVGTLPAPALDTLIPILPDLVMGRAVLERRTIQVEDLAVAGEDEYPGAKAYQARYGQRTTLVTPLLREGETIGAIYIWRVEVRPFTDKQIELLKTFADQAAIAIENVRLFDETQRLLKETEQRAAELQIINSVQQGLASQLDMQAIYDLVGDKIREIFDAQSVLIGSYDYAAEMIYLRYGIEKGQRPHGQPLPFNELHRRIIRTRELVLINEDMERRGAELEMRNLSGEGTKSGVWVPLTVGDLAKGFISLQNVDRENAFGESDVRLLTMLASSMSVALENARLFDETQRRAGEMEALTEIGREISSTLDLGTVLDRIAKHARELLVSSTSAVYLLEPDGRTLRPIVAFGDMSEAVLESRSRLGEGILGHIAHTGVAEFVNDVTKDSRTVHLEGTPETEEGEKVMVAPLFSKEQVIGTMVVWRESKGNVFTQDDLNFLLGLARQAAIAIENARLYQDVERRAQEMTATSEVLRIISSSPSDVDPVLDAVARKAAEICDATDSLIWLAEGDRMRIAAGYGPLYHPPRVRNSLQRRSPAIGSAGAPFSTAR